MSKITEEKGEYIKTMAVINKSVLLLFSMMMSLILLNPFTADAAPLAQIPVSITDSDLVYVGEFNSAAYCGCDKCCGKNRRKSTFLGTELQAGHSVAADLKQFQIGDELVINGCTYTVEDKAAQSGGPWINIYFDDHQQALEYGKQVVTVYKIPAKPIDDSENLLGIFDITGYCSCRLCCGEQTSKGLTYLETTPTAGHTIAADPELIPLGSQIEVDGVVYTVEDTGSAIKGKRLDIYFDTHEEAVIYGRRYKAVYSVLPRSAAR